MFSGIIGGISKIIEIKKKKKFHTYTVRFSPVLLKNLKIGDSVAHNGCCLTVKGIDKFNVIFDIMQITLESTNLGILNIGDYVNIERSIKYGDEIGGHIISGHVMNTAIINKILKLDKNYTLWFQMSDSYLMKYIFYKGFICIDGISLTVGKIINNMFSVSFIPETLLSTTMSQKKVGYLVNIEIDSYTQIIVDTTERFLKKNNFIL